MKVGIVTLGCDKNTVDSEYIAGALKRRGLVPVPAPREAPGAGDPAEDLGAVVINTCGFIGPAKEESIATILHWDQWRRRQKRRPLLAVVGCLTQRYADELAQEMPEIDLIAGVGQFDEIARILEDVRGQNGRRQRTNQARRPTATFSHPFYLSVRRSPSVQIKRVMERVALERRTVPYAILKIADGCNYRCSFCAIPRMKGAYRSVPRHIVLHEARALLDEGARELCIVAQDTPKYGRDLYRRYRLADLLHEICAMPGDFRVRLFYLYPTGLTRELIELWKSEPKLCRYVDIPLQHLDPAMLRLMRRPSAIGEHLEWINRLRAEIPGFTIRTTFIVGHPGETQARFRNLLSGMQTMRFERAGVFEYSDEEEVHAAKLPGRVPAREKRRRRNAAMALQRRICAQINEARIGSVERVLVEFSDPALGLYIGRSDKEAPDVDGLVLFQSRRSIQPGEFADVRITRADTYDVFGEEVQHPA
ncbi:MAG: 30S ribosomal protein S12 methylthiotransferase RimO [Candidatus Sumerlaeia bacterium]